MERSVIFLITAINVAIFFVLFNILTRDKQNSYRHSINFFGKYKNFSIVFFIGLFFASWTLNELFTKTTSWGYATYIFEIMLFFFQGTLILFPLAIIYSETKKPESPINNPKKLKKLTTILLIFIIIIVVPLASISYNNKLKRDEQIKNLENQGINVYSANYYFSGKTNPTMYYNLTEVIELIKTTGIQVTISNGSPSFHFLTVFGSIQIWFIPPEGRISMIII